MTASRSSANPILSAIAGHIKCIVANGGKDRNNGRSHEMRLAAPPVIHRGQGVERNDPHATGRCRAVHHAMLSGWGSGATRSR